MATADTQKTEQPAPASQPSAIQKLIFDQTAKETEQAINDKIEDKKNEIRNGDGSFWGMIKGFIFALAEAFHFDKWLAKMFNSPIPEDDDVKAISKQVATTVSNKLANDPAVKNMTPEQLQAEISRQVKEDLQKHHGEFASFSDDQLEQTAATVGQKTRENFSQIKNKLYPEKPTNSNVALKGTPDEQVRQSLSFMADDLMNSMVDDATPEKMTKLAPIKHDMIELGAKLIKEHPDLVQKPDELAKLYVEAVEKDPALTAKIKEFQPALDLNNQLIKDGFITIMAGRLNDYAGQLASAVKGEAKEITPVESNPSDALGKVIARTVAEKIKQKAIDGAKENSYAPKEKEIVNSPSGHSSEEVDQAKDKLYKWVVSKGYVFNSEQRTKIGEVVSDATLEVIKNPDNKGLSQKDMADKVQKNVESRLKGLKGTKDDIDKLGFPPLDTVNYNNGKGSWRWNVPADSFAKIAEETANSLRDPKDPDGFYKMLVNTQNAFLKQQAAKAMQNTGDKTAASVPLQTKDLGNLQPPLQNTPGKTEVAAAHR